MGNQIGSEQMVWRATGRRGVALDVAGADLMLRGRFSDWESGLMMGPDLDKVGVRLAIDATSATGSDDGTEPLFTFKSRAVAPVGPGTYVAKGTFSRPGGQAKPVEMTVETPPGHTALFVISFATEKSDFGDGWAELVENVIPSTSLEDGQPARRAHAWLTMPVLAAA